MSSPPRRRVALLTLGCARNDVDSEELAGRLAADGWDVVGDDGRHVVGDDGRDVVGDDGRHVVGDDGADDEHSVDAVLVNTCGFIAAAKKDSIDTVLAATDSGAPVIAIGCLAERYGDQLAAELPEADAVLGFDHYPQIGARVADVIAGRSIPAHKPRDRRALLPISPADRSAAGGAIPGHAVVGDVLAGAGGPASGPRQVVRRRLGTAPVAPLKLASGCDRRCAFCAIPRFRGAFVSRRPADVLAEARWLADSGVRELYLVSENSTSYGKDLGDLRLLEALLPDLAAVPGIDRVRASYLQPAEMRPSLVAAIAATPGIAPYFDLSFQHASEPLLRRMRRFGGRERFLELIDSIRAIEPAAGVRTNVILGFPGESEDDVEELERFLAAARLDAVGVFGYSDEDGAEAAGYGGKLADHVIAERVERIAALVEEVAAQRAADRVGDRVGVIVDRVDGNTVEGRAAHQAPEVDGTTELTGAAGVRVGALVEAIVLDADGVDLVAEVVPVGAGSAAR